MKVSKSPVLAAAYKSNVHDLAKLNKDTEVLFIIQRILNETKQQSSWNKVIDTIKLCIF